MQIEIKHRYSGNTIFAADAGTLGECVRLARYAGANLRGADLRCAKLGDLDLSAADLRGADLRGACLTDSDLSDSDMSDANFRAADLRGACLSGTDLSGANLFGVDLRDANLRYADLRYADLSAANLFGADLRGADLCGAKLRGVAESLEITVDPMLPQMILDAIESDPTSWDQESLHSHCNTRHCIAGFATHLSGPLGKYLDRNLETSTAATLLLWTPGCEMPSFESYATKEETLDRLRVMADKAKGSAKAAG